MYKRLTEELTKLDMQINQEKTRIVNLETREKFSFLGFDFRSAKTRQGKCGVHITPKMKARTALLTKLKNIFRQFLASSGPTGTSQEPPGVVNRLFIIKSST